MRSLTRGLSMLFLLMMHDVLCMRNKMRGLSMLFLVDDACYMYYVCENKMRSLSMLFLVDDA